MLLIDRLLEIGLRWVNGYPDDTTSIKFGSILHRVPVYELSHVVPLFQDWKHGRTQAIPKRPPHDKLWCEWEYTEVGENGQSTDWTLGVYLEDNSSQQARRSILTQVPEHSLHSRIANAELVYAAHFFNMARASSAQPREGMVNVTLWEPRQYLQQFAFCLNNNSTEVGTVGFVLKPDILKEFYDARLRGETTIGGWTPTFFNLPGHIVVDYPHYDQLTLPWPAFMAFALLHCKNVVTQTHKPDPKVARECARHNRPKRVTYKTLHIEVPTAAEQRRDYASDDEPSGPVMRFHLCRGHFKNLQHERYKKKGWHWWPAHWRGSKNLGTVEKRYQLDSRDDTTP